MTSLPVLSGELRGAGFFSDFSNQCNASGYTAIEPAVLRYRPRGPGNDSVWTSLSFHMGSNIVTNYQYRGAPLADGDNNEMHYYAQIGSFASSTSNPNPRPYIRRLATPAGSTHLPDEIHLVIEVIHFAMIPDCTARGNFLLHPM